MDLATLDLTAQAELVRGRKASPRELIDAAIARLEKLNPRRVATDSHQRRCITCELRLSQGPLGATPAPGS